MPASRWSPNSFEARVLLASSTSLLVLALASVLAAWFGRWGHAVSRLFFWVLFSIFASVLAAACAIAVARTRPIGWLLAIASIIVTLFGLRACALV
jgi:hypothetical protein